MRIIDAHAHVIERLRGFNQHGEAHPIGKGRVRWADGEEAALIPETLGGDSFTSQALLSLMNRFGVEKAVLLQGSLSGFQNEYTYEAARAYPDRFIPGCTFDPFALQAEKILDRFLNTLCFRVFKFECGAGSGLMSYHTPFALDCDRMLSIYDTISKTECTLVFDLGEFHTVSHQPKCIANIARRYPQVKIVLCHLLLPTPGDENALRDELSLLTLDNVWFDLSALPALTWPEPYPFEIARKHLKIAKEIVGAEKLLWGSDAPSALTKTGYGDLITFITESDLFTARETEDVFCNNARSVYPY